jgi:hypothetical protein
MADDGDGVLNDLPDYQGCLNLLHALYGLWWRDAQRSEQLLADLADWTGQSITEARANRPRIFRTNRKDDLFDE